MDAVIHPDWLGWKAGTSTCSDACREWSLSCLLTQTWCDMFVHELLRVMEYNLPPATRLAPLLSLSLTHTHARTDTNTAACEITPLHKVEQSCHIWPKCMFMILRVGRHTYWLIICEGFSPAQFKGWVCAHTPENHLLFYSALIPVEKPEETHAYGRHTFTSHTDIYTRTMEKW